MVSKAVSFVIFGFFIGRFFVSLAEVKSVHDAATKYTDVSVTGDARVVKNNKRSAQHQLRDHVEMIEQFLEGSGLDDCIGSIQNFIMWPFLSPLTKDPKQVVIKRWKEDGSLHVFEDRLQEQRAFDAWFLENVLNNDGCDEKFFSTMLNRLINFFPIGARFRCFSFQVHRAELRCVCRRDPPRDAGVVDAKSVGVTNDETQRLYQGFFNSASRARSSGDRENAPRYKKTTITLRARRVERK